MLTTDYIKFQSVFGQLKCMSKRHVSDNSDT